MQINKTLFFPLLLILIPACLCFSGCSRENDDNQKDPFPFPEIPEDNNGSKTRSITYVYDRTAVDASFPPRIDSSVILFAYDPAGKIDRIRLTHADYIVYDFSFERIGDKLTFIHCRTWVIANPEVDKNDFELEYNSAGKVSLLKFTSENDPRNEIDSLIVKSSGTRIDTIMETPNTFGFAIDKYALKYNSAGDITRREHIISSGNSFVFKEIYNYTLSVNPAAIILGDEGLFWNFFAHRVVVSSTTSFLIPAILFHSAKQPSKLELQVSGSYTGTYNYQTEYYSTGLPKKMTAKVITQTGAFYAREAYYYTYAK